MQISQKNKQIFRIIAALLFCVYAIIFLYFDYGGYLFKGILSLFKNCFRHFAFFSKCAYFVGLIVIAIGLFANKSFISAIGAALAMPDKAMGLVYAIQNLSYYSIVDLASVVILIASGVLLFIACINRKRSALLGTCAGGAYFVSRIIYGFYLKNAIFCILFVLTSVFLGFAFDSGEKTVVNASSTPAVPQTYSAIEKLTKLKSLLDSGIITQEEFDEKKKQILGM